MIEALAALFGLLIIMGLVVGFFLLVLSIVRLFVEQGWQYRSMHRCGYTSLFPLNLCPRCGETTAEWERVTVRPKWPWGWEVKK